MTHVKIGQSQAEDAIIVADLQTRLRSLITARNAELSSARVALR